MQLNELNAITPIDGRYRSKVEKLGNFFSEFALIKYRVKVEIEYFIALCELPLPQLKSFPKKKFGALRDIYENISEKDALLIKKTETVTNHDVKAVEYFIKEKMDALNFSEFKEFIHFGLTSQDINNTAFPMMLKDADSEVLAEEMHAVFTRMQELADEWKDVPMLAKTHGQPASPTKLGKEILVFVERLINQIDDLENIPFASKFGGATGNFNAHHVAYPKVDWQEFANNFIEEKLELYRYQHTTQIEHYDYLAAYFDAWKRINTILIDFCRDIWTYVSMEYFKQKLKKGEIGSSAMPHKVNPIDFENAEGNLGVANALFQHLSAKLPISRLQRDLTDSTVLRNIGVPFSHTVIAMKSIMKGLNKLLLNESKLQEDLEKNWIVVAEAIQTVLRREAYPNPYEELKALTRTNEQIGEKQIQDFIESLKVSDEIKKELKLITPFNFTGIF